MTSITHKSYAKMILSFAVAAVMLFTISATAFAGVKITLINRTNSTVVAGYFSHHDNPNWGRDQLSEYIHPGQSYVVDFEPTSRYWDCKFVLKNGRETFKYNLDIDRIETLYIDL